MFAPSYPSWGCRCCTNSEGGKKQRRWNVYINKEKADAEAAKEKEKEESSLLVSLKKLDMSKYKDVGKTLKVSFKKRLALKAKTNFKDQLEATTFDSYDEIFKMKYKQGDHWKHRYYDIYLLSD